MVIYLATWASQGGKGDLDLLEFAILYFLKRRLFSLLVSGGQNKISPWLAPVP